MPAVHVQGCRLDMQAVAAPDAAPAAAPMVLLHEGLGSVSMWRDWPSRVARATGRAIWVHSRRGYGQSDAVTDVRRSGRLPPDYLHREAWNVLPVLLAQWGLQCPVLPGHSNGASIALLPASRLPVQACIGNACHATMRTWMAPAGNGATPG